MEEYSKGTWKHGNNHGDVVTDCGDGFPAESGHTATDYYGGFLIAESICKKADAKLIVAAPALLKALEGFVNSVYTGCTKGELEKLRLAGEAAIKKALL